MPWKFAPGQREVVVGDEDRVVADAVQLDLDLAARPGDSVVGSADHLRRGAHGIGVLDLGLDLAGGQVGALDTAPDGGGAAHRPGEAAQLVQARVVGLQVGQQRLEAHGAGDLGLAQPAVGVVDQQGAHRGEHVGAVDGAQPVARLQARDLDAGALHGEARRDAVALVERFALAHEREGELRHRGEVAAGAHGALLADDRRHAAVEHGDQRLGDLGADAGVAVGVHVDTSGHRAAHDFCGAGSPMPAAWL